jgi:hypothetical protein
MPDIMHGDYPNLIKFHYVRCAGHLRVEFNGICLVVIYSAIILPITACSFTWLEIPPDNAVSG